MLSELRNIKTRLDDLTKELEEIKKPLKNKSIFITSQFITKTGLEVDGQIRRSRYVKGCKASFSEKIGISLDPTFRSFSSSSSD